MGAYYLLDTGLHSTTALEQLQYVPGYPGREAQSLLPILVYLAAQIIQQPAMRIQSAVVFPLAQSQFFFPVAPSSTHSGIKHIRKLIKLFNNRLRNLARVSVLPKYKGQMTYRTAMLLDILAMQALNIQDRNAVNCKFDNGLTTSLADGLD